MTGEQQLLLSISKESLKGGSYELPSLSHGSLSFLMALSSKHQLLPLICETIYQSASLKENKAFLPYKNQAIRSAGMQKIRETESLFLYQKLLQPGVSPLIVKGLVCQSLYPKPILRISLDDDLFVPKEEDFIKCHEYLLKEGLTPDDPIEDIHSVDEISYHKKDSPLYIELHKSLFPKDSEAYGHFNDFFKEAEERVVTVQIEDVSVKTLCPTDHLLYLFLHAFKHFLHSGIGIRPVYDIALFADHYHSEIDWQYIKESLISVKAYDYARALFHIIEKYLLEDPSYSEDIKDWDIYSIDELPLLEDILESGIHGNSSLTRLHSSNITLSAFSNKEKRSSLLSSVFLPLRSMENRYSYLKKAPFLLPFAWGQRVFYYLKETRNNTSSDPKESIRLGEKRVELMRKYNVL